MNTAFLRAVGWLAALAAMPMAAQGAPDPIADDLARGACGTAAAKAEQTQASARGDAALADALALRTRVALACNRPNTLKLEDWLTRERALRAHANGADSTAVARVDLDRVHLEQLRNHADVALAAATALDERATRLRWPDALRGRIAARIASIQNQRAATDAALDSSARAIALARAAGDEATLVLALEERSRALIAAGREPEAVRAMTDATQIAKRHFGARSAQYAHALRYRAQVARMVGDYGTAIERLEQALAIQRALAETDQRLIATIWFNLGQTRKQAGDIDGAAEAYQSALDAAARDPDPVRPTRAVVLHSLANLERERGNRARAIELYAQVRPQFEKYYGADSPALATLLNNYGEAEAHSGNFADAARLYEQALAIARRRGSTDPGDYLPLANLAMLQIWQKRYPEAETGFRQALSHMKSAGAGSEGSALFPGMGLAASLWGQQRMDEALDAALDAEHTRQAALRLAASHLGEEQSVDLQEYQEPSLDLVIAIAAASGKPAHLERAWLASMAARDALTSIQAQRLAAVRTAGDTGAAKLWSQWRSASANLARAQLGQADPAGFELARAGLESAERALALATPLGSALAARTPAFAQIRKALPASESLVLFATARLREPSDFARDAADLRSPDVFAFLLAKPSARVQALRLGTLDAITQTGDAWVASLADRDVALATLDERGRKLGKLLWQPLRAAGAGQHWLLVPTDSLYRLPWGALPDPRCKSAKTGKSSCPLVESGFRAHILNHERELLAPAPSRDAPHLLALADPSLSPLALPPRARQCAQGLAALPGARSESTDLDHYWRTRLGPDATSTLLVGTDATEARLRSAAGSANVLHLGTHGIALGGDCDSAGDALAMRGASLAADSPLAANTPSLAPVALLLAAGNTGNVDDDGLLSAEEIAALDLGHTQLAVLAACSTASGRPRRYEGPFGLARAFRLAGVRTTVTSLWPVDDVATAQWSREFYRARYERNLGTADALASAQRAVLATRRARGESIHPYYWAAFTASGDWR